MAAEVPIAGILYEEMQLSPVVAEERSSAGSDIGVLVMRYYTLGMSALTGQAGVQNALGGVERSVPHALPAKEADEPRKATAATLIPVNKAQGGPKCSRQKDSVHPERFLVCPTPLVSAWRSAEHPPASQNPFKDNGDAFRKKSVLKASHPPLVAGEELPDV
jgi:hypothetical protein